MIDIDAARERLTAAIRELDALCAGRRQWKMSVPANEERDSDLVFARSLCDLKEALEELAKYEGGTWRTEHGHRWAQVRVDWCAAPFHCDMVCDVERDVWTGPERQPADQRERMLPTGSSEVAPPAGDREPVMVVQSFDHWPQPTQEQLDDAYMGMPQFLADLIAEAKGVPDAQS